MHRQRVAALATVAGLVLLTGGLAGCGSDTSAAKTAVLAAIDRTLTSPRTFTFVDHDLVNTTTTTGAIADDQRYQLLLSSNGNPQWQLVVKDDAVADYFPQRTAAAVYTGSGYGPENDVAATFSQVRSLLPPDIAAQVQQIYAHVLPSPRPVSRSLALASLQAGKWVLDATGAPTSVAGHAATTEKQVTSSPFYEPMVLLQDLQRRVTQLPGYQVHQWQKGDLSPTFKATDDPFPAPGPGEKRYDLRQAPLPTAGFNTARGIPPPPSNDAFLKIAVYVRDGRLSAVRYNYDVLDRLDDVVKAYKLPAKLSAAVGVELEEQAGQVVVDLLQGQQQTVPFRVHEETMLLSYPATPPDIQLPSPAVTADLSSVIPGQGSTSASPTPTPTAPATAAG